MQAQILFKLINRCTKQERRYISHYLKKFDKSEGKKYYKLFRSIQRYGRSRKISPQQSRYLFRQVVRLLSNYRKPLNSIPTAREKLEIGKVLYEKGLYEAAYGLLVKELPNLEFHQRWNEVVEYSELLIRLTRLLYFDSPKKLEYYIHLQEKAINIMLLQNKFNYLSSLIGYTFFKEGFSRVPSVRKKLYKILSSAILQTPPIYDDLLCDSQYYNINGIGYAFLAEYERSNSYFEDLLEVLEEKYPRTPGKEKIELITYINLCNNMLSLGNRTAFVQNAEKTISVFMNFPAYIESYFLTAFFSLTTNFYTRNFHKKTLEKHLRIFEKHKDQFKESEFLKSYKELILTSAIAFFALKKYDKVLKYIKEFEAMNIPRRKDLALLANILLIMTFYEQKQFDLIRSHVKKLKYKLSKEKLNNYPLERLLLKTIKELENTPLPEHSKVFRKTARELQQIYKQQPVQKTYLFTLPIEEWLDYQITGKSFQSYLSPEKDTKIPGLEKFLTKVPEILDGKPNQ